MAILVITAVSIACIMGTKDCVLANFFLDTAFAGIIELACVPYQTTDPI